MRTGLIEIILGWRDLINRESGTASMKTIDQLRQDFAIYLEEIERCENAKCFWALLHVLLALPDVCSSLETDPEIKKPKVGDRYVQWCENYLPRSATTSASDRYQMRNSLLHRGSTTAENIGKTHHTDYVHFSYVDTDTFGVKVHGTTNLDHTVLNVHVGAMAAETKQAVESWFAALQSDQIKMSHVERNIVRLSRIQPKKILLTDSDGSLIKGIGLTRSST
jgi:hypothetical protein